MGTGKGVRALTLLLSPQSSRVFRVTCLLQLFTARLLVALISWSLDQTMFKGAKENTGSTRDSSDKSNVDSSDKSNWHFFLA